MPPDALPISAYPTTGITARRRTLISTGLAMLLACAVLLPLLGHKPLTDWDEGIYAEVSREMLSQGWLVPHWNQQIWLEKPPLEMWLTSALFRIFGVNEFWARAISAFSGVGLVALLHGWLAARRDTLTAWLSSVILLATFGFLHVCRVGETDVLLSLGCTIALIGLAGLAELAEADRKIDHGNSAGWWLFWIGFAVAVMTKGAAAVVLPLTALLFIGLQRWRAARFGRDFWLGLALFLALVLPWHIAMFHRFGERFVKEYFGLHVLTRATEQIEGHTTHWWYYGKVLLLSAPPFVLLYPFAFAQALRRPSNLRIFALFALVVLGFFTVVETRLPHYIAPAYPALAVITAAYLADKLRPLFQQARPASFWIKLALPCAVIWAASILLTAPARKGLHSATLANGTTLPDNKEPVALLRSAFHDPHVLSAMPAGPLLLWREGRISSIATNVFYSGRHVQQVTLHTSPPGVPTDRYTYNPEPLSDAVTSEPQFILLDKALLTQIPGDLRYTPIRSSQTVELGTIVRTP